MNLKHTQIITVLTMVLLVFSACDLLPGTTALLPTQIPVEAIYTFAALTQQAQLTLNPPPPLVVVPTSPVPTDTPLIYTATLPPTPTNTATLPFTPSPIPTFTPPFTPTSMYKTITATMDTNCREGPGPEYDRVGALLVGDVAEVIGRNSAKTWWYIRDPRNTALFCWVWGVTTHVGGDTVSLPVYTAPPPPASKTPSEAGFSPAFVGKHKCSGVFYAFFSVKNKGNSAFESLQIRTRDMTDDVILSDYASSNNPFVTSASDCPPGNDALAVGKSAYVASEMDPTNSGNEAKTSIMLCTKEDLNGECETVVVKFTIP